MTSNFDDNPENKKDYEVGYKKPPRHGQFKPGQSGNLKGRPKGAKNIVKNLPSDRLSDLILEEANREVKIQEGNKTLTISMAQAALRSMSINAAKGKHQSQKLFLTMVREIQTEKENEKCDLFQTTLEYKNSLEAAIEYAEKHTLPIPDPIPHPYHIIVDPRAGNVRFIGPMSKEQKKDWDLWVARKIYWTDLLKDLEQELKENKNHEITKSIQDDIGRAHRWIDLLRKQIPDDIYIPPSTLEFVETKPDIFNYKT